MPGLAPGAGGWVRTGLHQALKAFPPGIPTRPGEHTEPGRIDRHGPEFICQGTRNPPDPGFSRRTRPKEPLGTSPTPEREQQWDRDIPAALGVHPCPRQHWGDPGTSPNRRGITSWGCPQSCPHSTRPAGAPVPLPSQKCPGIVPGGTNPARTQQSLRPEGERRDTRVAHGTRSVPTSSRRCQPQSRIPPRHSRGSRLRKAGKGTLGSTRSREERDVPTRGQTEGHGHTGTAPHPVFPWEGRARPGREAGNGNGIGGAAAPGPPCRGTPGLSPLGDIQAGLGLRGGPAAVNRSPAPDLGEGKGTGRKNTVTARPGKREPPGWD